MLTADPRTPAKRPAAVPTWARLIDGAVPFALAAAGLLVPDHHGLFYLALGWALSALRPRSSAAPRW